MLLEYLPDLWCCVPLLMLILFLCARHAYRVNARRSENDADKRNFHLASVWLSPLTWPLFILAYSTLFLIKVILYSAFLFAVLLALIAIRKPFLLTWLDKIAIKVGKGLLEANMLLVRVFFGKQAGDSQT